MTQHQAGRVVRTRGRLALGFVLLCVLSAPRTREASGAGPTWLVVMQSASVRAEELQNAIAPLGGTIVSAYPELGTFVVEADAGFRTAAAAVPGVASVVPNVPLSVVNKGATAVDR